MKNKNILMIVIIVIFILFLCIGYSFVTGHSIFINGSASASKSEGDFSVIFDTSVTPKKSSKSIKSAKIDTEDVASVSVDLEDINTVETATFSIKNVSTELNAKVNVEIVDTDDIIDEYFEVTPILDSEYLNIGESSEVKVEVKLKKEPSEDISGNFKIKIDSIPE